MMVEDLLAGGASEDTIAKYEYAVIRFADFIGRTGGFTEDDVRKYMAHLRKEGKSDNYRRFTHYALKRYFSTLGLDLSLKCPKVARGEVQKNILTLDQIERLIVYAKSLEDRSHTAYFAVSTTYGLRRKEITLISSGDVREDRLLVRTQKGGEYREHIIPDAIKPYINPAFFSEPRSEVYMSVLFQRTMRKLGVTEGGYGWHSVRRALITELVRTKQITEPYIRNFLRWRDRGNDMLYEYTMLEAEEVDRTIFEVHPFLRFWDRKNT